MPARQLVEATDSHGLDANQRDLVLAALEQHPEITAVYSIGGGNTATLDAFAALGRTSPSSGSGPSSTTGPR